MAKRASYKKDVRAEEAPQAEKPVERAGEAGVHVNQAARKAADRKKAQKGALSTLRGWLPALLLLAFAVAFVARVPLGNFSSFGWEQISMICPVGALSTLLASKSFIPHAVVSLALFVAFVLLFGRAFCSWACSVPLMQRVLGVDPDGKKKAKKASPKQRKAARDAAKAAAAGEGAVSEPAAPGAEACVAAGWEVAADGEPGVSGVLVPADASAGVQAGCAASGGCAGGSCGSCREQRRKLLDARHWILGGSLLSAAVFGFPVFCVVCPIGLTFALVFLIVRLFSGSVSWALLVVPLMLVVELVFLRTWCHRFCPIGALMSLLAKFNKTFVPTIDPSTCIETTTGHTCGRCAKSCPEHIDLRDLAAGERPLNECVKCRRCVDACPKKAISMPLLPKRGRGGAGGGAQERPLRVRDGAVETDA